MTDRKNNLTPAELKRAIAEYEKKYAPLMLFEQVAEMLGCAPGTLRDWKSQGHFKDCFRKRGGRLYFWRDRVLKAFFNGPEWSNENE